MNIDLDQLRADINHHFQTALKNAISEYISDLAALERATDLHHHLSRNLPIGSRVVVSMRGRRGEKRGVLVRRNDSSTLLWVKIDGNRTVTQFFYDQISPEETFVDAPSEASNAEPLENPPLHTDLLSPA